jgi:hypothetical protein
VHRFQENMLQINQLTAKFQSAKADFAVAGCVLALYIRAIGAGVAEWQTRQTQNLLSVRTWGFKSLHPHQYYQYLGTPRSRGNRSDRSGFVNLSLLCPYLIIARAAVDDPALDLSGDPRAGSSWLFVRGRAVFNP